MFTTIKPYHSSQDPHHKTHPHLKIKTTHSSHSDIHLKTHSKTKSKAQPTDHTTEDSTEHSGEHSSKHSTDIGHKAQNPK